MSVLAIGPHGIPSSTIYGFVGTLGALLALWQGWKRWFSGHHDREERLTLLLYGREQKLGRDGTTVIETAVPPIHEAVVLIAKQLGPNGGGLVERMGRVERMLEHHARQFDELAAVQTDRHNDIAHRLEQARKLAGEAAIIAARAEDKTDRLREQTWERMEEAEMKSQTYLAALVELGMPWTRDADGS